MIPKSRIESEGLVTDIVYLYKLLRIHFGDDDGMKILLGLIQSNG